MLEATAAVTTLISSAEGGTAVGLTFGIALGVGMIAQVAARHLRMPGIVLLLAAGVLLGPDLLGLIDPQDLGSGLTTIVTLAVAIILFEGGLNLNFGRLRREGVMIRRLVTVGAIVTGLGGTLTARLLLDWTWQLSAVFGALVIVTGPTVVTPLLRRIRLQSKLHTILEAEGVLIDPIGAIIAVVTVEVVLSQGVEMAAAGLLGLPLRLGVGALIGIAGGLIIGGLLRYRKLIPEDLTNVFTLSLVVLLAAISEALVLESAIVAAPVAGAVVGNLDIKLRSELMEFKEELTVMLVGMLFVVLAAGVGLSDVEALGWPGVATIAVLMFVVRPLNVAICGVGTDLNFKQKAFIAWLGPRGIVAAAVAALFAQRLTDAGVPGGVQLEALVFLVIAATVVIQGLSAGLLASILGLAKRSNQGFVLIGANRLGRSLASTLEKYGDEAVLVDTNATEANVARDEGYRVVYGNAHDESVLYRADAEGRRWALLLTVSDGANLLIANSVRRLNHPPPTAVAVARGPDTVKRKQLLDRGHRLLFGKGADLGSWNDLLRSDEAVAVTLEFKGDVERAKEFLLAPARADTQFLPLLVVRSGRPEPVTDQLDLKDGDLVEVLVLKAQRESILSELESRGLEVLSSED